jgi:hypothetical protein
VELHRDASSLGALREETLGDERVVAQGR